MVGENWSDRKLWTIIGVSLIALLVFVAGLAWWSDFARSFEIRNDSGENRDASVNFYSTRWSGGGTASPDDCEGTISLNNGERTRCFKVNEYVPANAYRPDMSVESTHVDIRWITGSTIYTITCPAHDITKVQINSDSGVCENGGSTETVNIDVQNFGG